MRQMASAVAMAHPSRPRGVPADGVGVPDDRVATTSDLTTETVVRSGAPRVLSALGAVVVGVVALLVTATGGSGDAGYGGGPTSGTTHIHSRFGPVVHNAAPVPAGAPHHSPH